jgi:predicted metal-binding protein
MDSKDKNTKNENSKIKKDETEQIITRHGFNDFKWIVPRENIVVSSWVRFRCQFGCNNYGKNGSCPPAVPPVEECRHMIYEYEDAVIFHFPMRLEDDNDHLKLMSQLYELERAIFLAGNYKVFLLQYGSCMYCKNCPAGDSRVKCINQTKSRPGADAMGIDVYQTARSAGYHIQVVKSRDELTNRFAFILLN